MTEAESALMHQTQIPTVNKIPPGMATMNQLLGRRLVLSSKQQAVARLRFPAIQKEWSDETQTWVKSSVERSVDLFQIAAARPMTSLLQLAEMDYYDLFVQDASTANHLAVSSGKPVKIDGHPYIDAHGHQVWDDGKWAVDESGEYVLDIDGNLIPAPTSRKVEGGWQYRQGPISRSSIKNHLNGRDVFGVLGGRFSRFFVLDVDLHSGDPEVYKHRLDVLIPLFWGRFRSSFSISQGGVHIIGTLPKRERLNHLRSELTRSLHFHSGNDSTIFAGDNLLIELFPDSKRGIRLPLACGRVVFCDGILHTRTLRSGKQVPDVREFIKWTRSSSQPSLSPMDVINQAINYAKPRTPRVQSVINVPGNEAKPTQSLSFASQKGNFLHNLVSFWSGSMPYLPGLLNNMLLMSTRLLIHSGHSDDSIINVLSDLSKSLRESGYTSNTLMDVARLRSHFLQKIRECRDNTNQPDPGLSTAKMRGVAEYCKRIGFRLDDSSTWYLINNTRNNLSTSILCEPKFDSEDKKVIQEKIAPILKSDTLSAEYSIRRLLGWLGNDNRQLSSRNLLPKLLDGTGVKIGNHGKQRRFLRALVKEGFIEIVREYSPPSARRLARTYALTKRMKEKLVPGNTKGMSDGN
ncbi:hypothetical protein K2X85_21075 [bacterium]|nr:hypothetical protein [bacterium]